jgi:hypothetical protein
MLLAELVAGSGSRRYFSDLNASRSVNHRQQQRAASIVQYPIDIQLFNIE